jgi:hypothetical protein
MLVGLDMMMSGRILNVLLGWCGACGDLARRISNQ